MTTGVLEALGAANGADCLAMDPFSLAEANINPLTGLSTDYLNLFNEAVMLLDLVPSMPECREDIAQWRPLGYHEHFARSNLKHRELAIAAYDLADVHIRRQFDELCDSMKGAVVAVQKAFARDVSDTACAMIAQAAAARMRPMIASASGLIHGREAGDGAPETIEESQDAIDAILSP